MKKSTKNALLDIAADLIVSPIAAYAAGYKLKKKWDDSEAKVKTKAKIKELSESETVAKVKEAAKEAAKKAGEGISSVIKPKDKEEAAPEEGEVAEILDDVDLSEVITEEDAAQPVPEAPAEPEFDDVISEEDQADIDSGIDSVIDEISENKAE